MICDKCGTEYGVGDFPFCKGGHGRYGVNVIDDTIEGGPRFFETLGHEPVWIESKSQLAREAAARGKVPASRHDRAYYDRLFRQTNERYRDEGTIR